MENRQWAEIIWRKIEKKISAVTPRLKGTLPYEAKEGKYNNFIDHRCMWTNGFWGGIMWIMYLRTNNELYKEVACNTEEMVDDAFKNIDGIAHDVGFMWMPTSGINYKIFGDSKSKERLYYAANLLAGRFNVCGNYIQAWSCKTGWSIIDCMMNLSVLYFISKEYNNPRFKNIANAHANMTINCHLREDGSVVHIASHNPDTGEFIENISGQGYSADSVWSRGQAWAIYGFAISYHYTKEIKYLNAAKIAANYFIAAVCSDYLPKSDFKSPLEPLIYDSSAGAIAACGLLQLSKQVVENESYIYKTAAIRLLKAIETKFCDWNPETDAILTEISRRYHPYEDSGIAHKNVSLIFGDYYFIEAIYKLCDDSLFLW